jgi:predicted Zn-dependent protease
MIQTVLRFRELRLACIALLVAALASGVSGCATNPVSGNPELVFSSREDELKAGREAAEMVAQQMGLMPDSARTRYVKELGASLAIYSPRQDIPYEFHIVDMKEPNAFALPGGYIYVSRGLLLLANDESALAGAVGHEIGHAAARHAVQRQTRAAPLGVLSGVTAGVVGLVSPTLGRGVGAVGGLANSAALAPYGRGQEREADRVGQDMAAEAGYAPDGISQLLESLGREHELHEDRKQGPSFLSTHPSSDERVANTRTHAEMLQRANRPTPSPTQGEFYARLDGLVVGDRAAGGVFVDDTLFLQPEMDFQLKFPDEWKTHNSNSFVGAVAPEEDSAVILQLDEPSRDPVASARAFLAEAQLSIGEPRPIEINGMMASRVVGTQGGRGIVLTWILRGEQMFQITAVGPEKRFERERATFEAVAGSFAKLTSADRDRVHETRIRIFTANAGESLAQLVARAKGEGELDFIAVVNGIEVDTPLRAGQLLKIPVSERYRAGS